MYTFTPVHPHEAWQTQSWPDRQYVVCVLLAYGSMFASAVELGYFG